MADTAYAADEPTTMTLLMSTGIDAAGERLSVALTLDALERGTTAGPTIPTTGQLWPRGDW